MRRPVALLALLATALTIPSATAQREPPYWASIRAARALMRAGPGRNYPGTWMYVRPDLPIRIVGVMDEWRRVQDPDGTIGWMLVSLLSDRRTGIVRGQAPAPMYEEAREGAAIRYRAEPGVVGRLSDCDGAGWCLFDVAGKRGYIKVETLWGVEAAETVG